MNIYTRVHIAPLRLGVVLVYTIAYLPWLGRTLNAVTVDDQVGEGGEVTLVKNVVL